MLRAKTLNWLGTPHRLGGNNRDGIDCSGLVVRFYNDLFDIRLPRSTKEQVKKGRFLPRHLLLPGDLVFFKSFFQRHVGIYLGDGEFVHVSSRQGVIVSNMNESYWDDAYWTARRLL
jgi:cell wall-associated NlpC family hydrolase